MAPATTLLSPAPPSSTSPPTITASPAASTPAPPTPSTVRKLSVAPKLVSVSKPPAIVSSAMTKPPAATSPYQLQDAQISQLSTSKVWVLPPRPKPGRKPSTDTPPTKRKAQNRAAQRAFRERRAARVTELEALLEDVNNERDQKERKLNDTLKAMSQENYELRRSLEELRREIRAFSSSRPYNDIASPRLEQPPHILQQQPYSPSSNPPSHIRHSSISYPPSMNQMASPAPSLESPMDVLDRVLELRLPVPEEQHKNKELSQQQQQQDDDCGVCIKEDCICETLGIREKRDTPASSPAVSAAVESQQQLAPGTVQLKRRRKSASKNLNPFKKMKKATKPEEMEVDFTKVFAKEKAPKPSVIVEQPVPQPEVPEVEIVHSTTSTPMDPCGFCSDGTPCLCAETAEQEASSMAELNTLPPLVGITQSNSSNHNSLSPSVSLPSSRNGSISNLVKLPALSHEGSGASTPKSGCTGKPGTCQQCQADPMSTLFCTTLANQIATTKPAMKSVAKPAGGCCGGSKSGGGGCCKDKAAVTASAKPPQQQQQQQFQQQLLQRQRQYQQSPTGSGASTPLPGAGTFIPCSAAYQTLSRHKDFGRVDLGTLVGKLQTRGMQVEVSSVANVLRELDKRLYQ
ncbi:hypothetical protein D0Z00_000469 [Geotrichum galactomycetum]|uniref:Uncharacterized protein n=1 Tax=Geotrichum galactomycetum TaxID=27317 RepID=A0ACB6V9U0_9ASCO|nr:hypothetical protein D0Z00_000469 [Geotrichum candidum]